MMKKVMACLLAAAMVLSMAACGGTKSSETTAAAKETKAETSAEETKKEETEAAGTSKASSDDGSDVDYVKEKGKLVVGITEFEPMDYQNESGEWIGFDADMAKSFAESLGVDAEFVVIDWDNRSWY